MIGSKIGCFDEEKMNKIINVLTKFAPIIFNDSGSAMSKAESLVHGLTPDTITPETMFRRFDKDGSGALDFEEFQELCKYMGLFLN